MERKEILDRARVLCDQVKRKGLPGGWTLKEEFDFQQNGEDLSIDVACEPYQDVDVRLQTKEDLEVELVATALEELERKGIPPIGESYRQDVQVIKPEHGEAFRLFLELKHYDATTRSAV